MVVVLGIITAITAILLLGRSTFNRSIILTDVAYTVAFTIREAQVLGLSSRSVQGIGNAGYGLNVNRTQLNQYTLFADRLTAAPGSNNATLCPGHTARSGPDMKPGNCILDATEDVRRATFNNGFRIARFCGMDGATRVCSGTGSTDLLHMNITYLRPSTLSTIVGRTNGGTFASLSDATIYITSPDSAAERCVYISKVGQVSVHQKGETNCP